MHPSVFCLTRAIGEKQAERLKKGKRGPASVFSLFFVFFDVPCFSFEPIASVIES